MILIVYRQILIYSEQTRRRITSQPKDDKTQKPFSLARKLPSPSVRTNFHFAYGISFSFSIGTRGFRFFTVVASSFFELAYSVFFYSFFRVVKAYIFSSSNKKLRSLPCFLSPTTPTPSNNGFYPSFNTKIKSREEFWDFWISNI